MFSAHCNIDKTDRINSTVIGHVLCIAVLIVEGVIGWCSISYLINKMKCH